MRFQLYLAFFFICLTTLSSVQCQNKKSKLQEYNERDRKDTKEKFSKRDLERNDEHKFGKFKFKIRDDDNDEVAERKVIKRDYRNKNENNDRKVGKKFSRREEEDEVQTKKSFPRRNEEISKKSVKKLPRRVVDEDGPRERPHRKEENARDATRKYRLKKLQDSDEDDDSTDEDDDNGVCNKKGQNCDSNGDDDDNTDEDDDETDEDDSDEEEEVPVKKRVTYVKKFAHEKRKKNENKEFGSILKIHKKSGVDVSNKRGNRDDDDSSEEIGIPKLHRLVFEDDED